MEKGWGHEDSLKTGGKIFFKYLKDCQTKEEETIRRKVGLIIMYLIWLEPSVKRPMIPKQPLTVHILKLKVPPWVAGKPDDWSL